MFDGPGRSVPHDVMPDLPRWSPKWSMRAAARQWIVAGRARLLAGLVAASSAVFLLLALVLRESAGTAADLAISGWIQRIEDPAFDASMVLVSAFGFPPLNWLALPAAVGGFWLAGFRREALFVAASAGAGLLAGVAKLATARPRPDAGVVRVAGELLDHSFPSGHVVSYVSFYGFLFFLTCVLFRRPVWRTGALLGFGLLVSLVGLSRIYLGHHWASDVLGGYALGTAYLAVLIRAYGAGGLRRARVAAQQEQQ